MHKLQQSFKNPSGKNVADSMIVQFLSFSVDPERDSVPILKIYADKYSVDHESWWMLTGNKKIIPLYIYGGLVGAIIYVVAFNTLPPLKHISSSSILLGASASVMAIAMATTTLAPNYRIFPLIGRGIPLWVLTLIFITIDTASILVNNTMAPLQKINIFLQKVSAQ